MLRKAHHLSRYGRKTARGGSRRRDPTKAIKRTVASLRPYKIQILYGLGAFALLRVAGLPAQTQVKQNLRCILYNCFGAVLSPFKRARVLVWARPVPALGLSPVASPIKPKAR